MQTFFEVLESFTNIKTKLKIGLLIAHTMSFNACITPACEDIPPASTVSKVQRGPFLLNMRPK